MKKTITIFTFLVILTGLFSSSAIAQKSAWLQQVIIGNGGRFEFNPPYQDYVTMQKYDPSNHATSVFNTIYTQSVQDILIQDKYAYVLAQDSVIMYDLDTYQRLYAVADSGLSRVGYYNGKLIITKQWPVTRFFVEILDATNLAVLARVDGLTEDCGGVIVDKDSCYVAVNAGYLGMEGKMAVINASTWTLVRTINFGPDAIGINDLYSYGGNVYAINRTPDGAADTGSITVYNEYSLQHVNKVFPLKVGRGLGMKDNLLYLKFNEGVGSFNMDTKLIADTSIIADPGSPFHIVITSGAVDYLNNVFYLNIGNQTSFGIDVVASLAGDSLYSFNTGLSADAIALDIRTPVGVNDNTNEKELSLYPNPVNEILNIRSTAAVKMIQVFDLTGKIVREESFSSVSGTIRINCSGLQQGLYFISVTTDQGKESRKFVKR
jgi:hypothetical protein